MVCHNCQIEAKRFGKDRKGNQRFRCNTCRKTFQEAQDKPLNNMYLPLDKAVLCLQLLVEGNSIRSTERITGVNRNTILDLLDTLHRLDIFSAVSYSTRSRFRRLF